MSTPGQRVFISAASTEFRPLRERLAAMLQRSGINVEHQEIFPQTASDTVRKLGDLIKECPLLVHIVGHQPGSTAAPDAVADLMDGIPADQFLARAPNLRQALGDFTGITYTQWEAFLALHHGVDLFLYAPADACEPGTQTLNGTFAQKTHLERLLVVRKRPTYCRDDAEFVGNILADTHRRFGLAPPAIKPQNLPYPSLGPLFKGRTEFLAQLRPEVGQDTPTIIRGRQAIHGMGGVGKTRAAVEFAWEHAGDYNALLFVTADSPDALKRNLAALCGPVLHLPVPDIPGTAAQLVAVHRWLNQHPGWFLILDNVDTLEAQDAVADLLADIPEGHVVITSRLADWPAGVTALDLDVLSEDSSIAFLLERTKDRRSRRTTDPENAAQIARMLDRLALALEQCAAYIRRRRCALADYVADWAEKRPAILAWHDERKSLYPRGLAITYDTSVAQLSEDARELLRMLAWTAPDPLPVWAVEKIASLPDPRMLLIDLADLHLARLSADGTNCTVHRLLQEITRQQQNDTQPVALTAALTWLNGEYPGDADDVEYWSIAISLAPHAIAAATFAADHEILEPSTRLLNQAALLRTSQGNYRDAEPLLRRALAIDEARYADANAIVAIRLNNLAHLLKATNRLGEAEPLMRRALAIDEARNGNADPSVSRDLNNLALLLQSTNRPGEAESLLRRALAIDQAVYADTDPEVATTLNNLALLLKATNRLGEAEPLLRRALAIVEANHDAAHPTVARALNNLAGLLHATSRMGEAEPLLRRALAIDEARYGDAHPDVARDLNSLARLLQATNRADDAEPLLRRALAIFEACYGDAHPRVATALSNLGQLLKATHRLGDAEPLMRRALDIDAASYGDAHPEVATDLNNLAQLLQATNRLDDAEPLMRRALAIDEASYGDVHPNVARDLNNLARLLQDTSRLGDAEPLMRRALDLDEASYGEVHPVVARDLNNLATLLQATDRPDEAEPLMRRALEILLTFTRDTGHEHPNLETITNNYAGVLQAMGSTEEDAAEKIRAMRAQYAVSG